MRLTLRTMLAYLDELLEPADRTDISNKLADSQFASQLVERIRNRIRSPRLASPKLAGRGMGLDPNTVAEYLDNTLAAERVPEFEKMCLPPADAGDALVESDVYLAEVAACHQILAMVLGQPAHIDPQMKRRMYGIINQVPPALPVGTSVDSTDEIGLEPEESRPRPARRRPEIPEYLRDRGPRSSWKPVIAAIVLFALLVAAITMALGPIDQLLGLNQPAKNAADNAAGQPEPPANTVVQQDNHADAAAGGNGTGSEAAANTENATGAPVPSGAVGDRYSDPGSTSSAVAKSTSPPIPPTTGDLRLPDTATPPATDAAVAAAANKSTVTEQSSVPPLPQPFNQAGATSTAAATIPDRSAEAVRNAAAAQSGAAAASPPANSAATPVVPNPTTLAAETPLGRVVPGKDMVLLKFDAASSHWVRMAAGSALSAGDQLLVLPTYRPTITLSAGLTLQIAPDTMLTLGGVNADGVPSIKLLFGRVVAMTTGNAGARLRIDVGVNSGTVTFTDADATLGVEVRRYFLAGANPELQEPRVAADLYAASGHLDWSGQDGSTATLNAPQRWPLSAPMPDSPIVEATSAAVPKWISGEVTNPIYNRPSESLAATLDAGKPLTIALQEMSTNRRVEFGAFAAECLALLDQFDPLIKMFNEPDQRPMWPVEIASVKAAIARGKPTASAVREAFEKQRGDVGKDLYRMFWGYTKDQLQNGEAAKLVEYLDHDNLDFRVLAFTNLQEITKSHHNYRPEANDQARKQPTRSWQEALRLGQIVPRDLPARQ